MKQTTLFPQVSEAAIIREMDADELKAEAQILYDHLNWYGRNSQNAKVLADLERCKRQYRQITGELLQLQYTCPA